MESQCKCHREHSELLKERRSVTLSVSDPSTGGCADPMNEGAISGKGGPDPQGGNKERQLSPDKGSVRYTRESLPLHPPIRRIFSFNQNK